MGDWERRIQEPDGGIMEGAVGTVPRRSVVFNTGMVLHGWLDLATAGHDGHEEAAARAAAFLTTHLRGDGTWDPRVEFAGIPHTYNARVAWAMLRWAARTGDEAAESAARRQLDWVVERQRANGWFDALRLQAGDDAEHPRARLHAARPAREPCDHRRGAHGSTRSSAPPRC